MKYEEVRYFVPGNLRSGALEGALRGLADSGTGNADSVTISWKDPHSTSGASIALGELKDVTELAPGSSLTASRAGEDGWLLQLDVLATRVELSLQAGGRKQATEALDCFCRSLNLAPARCLALSLSGGGFRATLFHLGMIRLLADIGKLKDVTHICSVSGGSILAAHLVQNWWRYTGDQFEEAAAEILRFAQADIRGRVFRRWLMGIVLLPFLRLRIWPWSRRWTRTSLLANEYDRLYGKGLLRTLDTDLDPVTQPPRPQLYLLATAMKTGAMCTFTGRGLQFEEARLYTDDTEHREQMVDGALLPISFAVAASSAFPPVFPPVIVTHRILRTDPSRFPHSPEYLSDGGVFDNLGIRKLQHLQSSTHFGLSALLVSDAEAPFLWQVGADYSAFWRRAVRSSDILMKRVANLEYDWAMHRHGNSDSPVLRCSISDVVDMPDALEPELVRATRQIRTDLDRFSDLEARCLVRQGYMVAKKVALENNLVSEDQRARLETLTGTSWDPTSSGDSDPKGESGVEHRVRRFHRGREPDQVRLEVDQLERNQRSTKRWIAAVFDLRDWATWVALSFLLLYAAVAGGTFLYNYLRAEVAMQEVQQWQSDFLSYRDAFQEAWKFQISYAPIAEVERQLDTEMRDLAALPEDDRGSLDEQQQAIVGSLARLREVAGVDGAASTPANAYISRHPVLGQTGILLFNGFVPRFQFPGSDDTLLLQFSGRLPEDDPNHVDLEFFQHKLLDGKLEAGGRRPVANFTVSFEATSSSGLPDHYQGMLQHPVLKDQLGAPLGFAKIELWKPKDGQ